MEQHQADSQEAEAAAAAAATAASKFKTYRCNSKTAGPHVALSKGAAILAESSAGTSGGGGGGGGGRGKGRGVKRCGHGNGVSVCVSARKMAARLWRHRVGQGHAGDPIVTDAVRFPRRCCRSLQGVDVRVGIANSSKKGVMKSSYRQLAKAKKNQKPLQTTASMINDDSLSDDSTQLRLSLEKATKWDSSFRTSDEVFKVYNGIRTLEEQQTVSVSVVTALRRELDQAHHLVRELEHAQRYSRKEVDRLLKKIAEDRAVWQGKEQEKVRKVIRKVKEELHDERKEKKRLEVLNGQLAKELAEAKITSMRALQELDKERKDRKLMEDVCNELAREIGEDKAQVEELKRESMKVREEVEEERKMLQMAEVWREERVQMKLIEAKLALEEKSAALDKLREGLETFINSRLSCEGSGISSDPVADMRDAQLLREVAKSIQIHEIKEFSYEPPTSDDIFSAFEEMNQFKGNNETSDARNGQDVDDDNCYSPASTTRLPTLTPRNQSFSIASARSHHESEYGDDEDKLSSFRDEEQRRGEEEEEESEWDYASEEGDQGSSLSSGESKTSLNGAEVDTSFCESGTEGEDKRNSSFMGNDIELYPISKEQTKKSSIVHFWKKRDSLKANPVDRKPHTATKSLISMASPGPQGVEGAYSPTKLGTWTSPDSGNPHVTRGIKGFIEWPRVFPKNTLKAKLLEAKMESQKSQLRHVLKQRH